ncbi:MAG: hypothetical protein AB1551_04290 [Actinomycetota bacterium]
MRARSRILLTVSVALALTSYATPAGASQVSDPNDVSGRLDLSVLIGTKAFANAPLVIKVRTYGNWGKRLLSDAGENRIYVLFDVDGDGITDYTGEISESGGKLHMDITGDGSAFEPLPVSHPNRRTIKTTVPGGSPPNPKGTLYIAARSEFTNSTSCATTCEDRIPDSGWLTVP